VKNTTVLGRYNSYESNNVDSCLTEDVGVIKANFERRMKKIPMIAKDSKSFSRYEIYDNKNKSSKNIILSWGSPKGAILDAIPGLKCKFLHVKYIEPFPEELEKELKGKNIILIENSSTGMLGDVLREKTGILIDNKNKILRYDGRPFLADELNKEIKRKLK
jgi:2-oxoglutarate ferredoxin oxidoreductase subunit alpha